MKLSSALAIAALLAVVSAEAASVASCSGWRATCMKRSLASARAGGEEWTQLCDSKFSECLSSGCWTEAPRFGGATHCDLSKK